MISCGLYVLYTGSGFLNHSTRKKPRFRELTKSDHCHITNNLNEFFFFFFGCARRPVGSWFPDQESNLCPYSGCTESYLLDPQGSPRSEGLTPKLLAPLLFISVQCWSLYCLQSCPQPSLQIPGPRVTAAARSPAREEGSLHIYRHESSLQTAQPCSCDFHVQSLTSP